MGNQARRIVIKVKQKCARLESTLLPLDFLRFASSILVGPPHRTVVCEVGT